MSPYRSTHARTGSRDWRRTAVLVLLVMFVVMPLVLALTNGFLG